jgi:hypothetical protein
MNLANPPGAEGSLGDAINWESLLLGGPQDSEIVIVSVDKHYASKAQKGQLLPFLTKEWQEEKNGEAVLYTNLPGV